METHKEFNEQSTSEYSSRESAVAAERSPEPSQKARARSPKARKDKQRLHVMRHAVLSQFPLQALARLGENVRPLRRMERQLRAELKPSGMLGDMLFDRGWSSYLRCLLAARAEETAMLPNLHGRDLPAQTPRIEEGEIPILMFESSETMEQNLSPYLFRQLLLVQRYDSHFSREAFRCFGLLLLLKNGGEAGLQQFIEKALGIRREP